MIVPNTRVVIDAEIESLRFPIFVAALLSIIGGAICAVTFWAVYFYGLFLGIAAIVIGTMEVIHASSVQVVRSNACCFHPRALWDKVHIANIVLLGCGALGAIVCIIAMSEQFSDDSWQGYIGLLGLLGCLFCAAAGAIGFLKCRELHRLLEVDAALVTPRELAALAVVVAHTPPAPLAQPVYGQQPAVAQPGYGAPPPYYPHPFAVPAVGYQPPQRIPGIEVVNDISEVMRSNLDAAGMLRQMTQRQAKIDVAAFAMISFLSAIMRPADRCSVTAFNNKFIPVVNLGDEAQCKAMMVYLTAICQDSTMLYDAIVLSVLQFVATADRGRPWLLIVLTDGADNRSAKTFYHAADALRLFTAAHNNHAFLVGVGNDVKTDLMERLASSTGSIYIPAEHASALPVLFAMIALQVQQGIQVDIAAIRREGAEAVLARVQRTQRVTFQNVDLLLLVDVSGSMASA